MIRPAFLSLSLLMSAVPLAVSCTRPDEGKGEGCGTITRQGLCEGSVVKYCDTTFNTVESYDCAEFAGTQCTEVNATFGVGCVANVGSQCLFDAGGGNYAFLFCSGTRAACVEKQGFASACEDNQFACTDPNIGQCTGTGRFVMDCFETVPHLVDCVSWGGSCVTGQGCTDLPAGAHCDDLTFDYYRCGSDLACVNHECVAFNTDAGPMDAGNNSDAAAREGSADKGAFPSPRERR